MDYSVLEAGYKTKYLGGLPLIVSRIKGNVALDAILETIQDLEQVIMIDLAHEDNSHVAGVVHGFVELSDPVGLQDSEGVHQPKWVVTVADIFRIDEPLAGKLGEIVAAVLNTLHFRVDNAGIVALAINVMDLRQAGVICDQWQENAVEIDRQDLGKPSPAERKKGVYRPIDISLRIGVRIGTTSQHIKEAIVRVVPRPSKAKVPDGGTVLSKA